jgi:hypothetical protein
MKDFVSRGIHLVLLAASLLVLGGIFLPAFPGKALVFVGAAASFTLWMASRPGTRSTSQVIWDVEAEPVRVAAQAPGVVPTPKTTL